MTREQRAILNLIPQVNQRPQSAREKIFSEKIRFNTQINKQLPRFYQIIGMVDNDLIVRWIDEEWGDLRVAKFDSQTGEYNGEYPWQ